jgi:hypothetical protein
MVIVSAIVFPYKVVSAERAHRERDRRCSGGRRGGVAVLPSTVPPQLLNLGA